MKLRPNLENAYELKTPEDNIELYSVWAKSYDSDFIDEMQYELHLSVANEFILAGGKGPVLDVGAGTGVLAKALLQRGNFSIEATDISEAMLEVAKSKNIYERCFWSDLTKQIPVANCSYNGVVSSGTFTHGHVGPSSIFELVRISKPGGVIVISVNEEHWNALDFKTEVRKISEVVKSYQIKKISIYGKQSTHSHKDDKALILTIKV